MSVYKFRRGSHVPEGVTPEGVMAEHDEIEMRYADRGGATINNSVEAVLASPERYPNLAPWGEMDPEIAVRRCVEEGLRHAYASVIVVQEKTVMGKPLVEPVEIRVFHAVSNEDGAKAYRNIEVIKKNDAMSRELKDELQRNADSYMMRQRNLLAELSEL